MFADRAARAFPFALLLASGALAAWLQHATTLPEIMGPGSKHDVDLVITQFHSVGFDADGHPRYRLTAKEMRHFPQRARSELHEARLDRHTAGEPDLAVSARTAQLDDRTRAALFRDDVLLQRAAHGQRPALYIQTQALWVDPQQGLARTDAAIEAKSGTQRLRGVGFEYNHTAAAWRLLRNVSIQYVSTRQDPTGSR
jgi:lipopolysaccharide export system protein LptC